VTGLYLDASAFVKVVVSEPQSRALRSFLSHHEERRVSSALLRTEALRAVRHLGAEALRRTRAALQRIDLVLIDDRILDAAGILDPAVLRTLDAIHLATALAMGSDLSAVLTYDERIIEAAQQLGLMTASPS
jgi:uncharacterized protein